MRRHPTAPPAVGWIARTLEEAGFETWAVGGAVRDVLVGIPSVDWDLATRARPRDVRRLFRRTVPIGVRHGTVGVLARDGTLYEVTTFRRDVKTFGRHATVEFADTVREDLSRRDFTINAIAWHPLRDELFDPFGGVEDLESGVLRTVGEARQRLAEDYLRVLRALRFAGRFSLEIDPATWRALQEATSRLDVLSRERVREELLKVLGADPAPERALRLYRASGVLAAVLPELDRTAEVGLPEGPPGLDAWSYGVELAAILPPTRPLLRLAALLQGVGIPDGGGEAAEARDAPEPLSPGSADPTAETRARWRTRRAVHRAAGLLLRRRFSNADVERVTSLLAAGPAPPSAEAGGAALRRWLSRVGAERLRDVARLWVARARVLARRGHGDPRDVVAAWRALRRELDRRPPLTVGDLALGGKDLIRMGMKPGPHFGRVLEGLLERVLDDPRLNDAETLAGLVREEWQGRSDVRGEGRG